MTKSKHTLDQGHYQRAVWFLEQPNPPRNWFDKGACSGAPYTDFPEDKKGPLGQAKQALLFIPKYCGNCVVKTECAVDMIRKGGIPQGNVHGGMMPEEAACIAVAAKDIQGRGGAAQAAPALGYDLTPIAPDYVVMETPPPQRAK